MKILEDTQRPRDRKIENRGDFKHRKAFTTFLPPTHCFLYLSSKKLSFRPQLRYEKNALDFQRRIIRVAKKQGGKERNVALLVLQMKIDPACKSLLRATIRLAV